MTVEKTRSAALDYHLPSRTADATRSAVCVMPAAAASVPVLRRFARDTARRWEASEAVDEAVAVIVTELVANAVRHSGSPDVTVLLAVTGATMKIQVSDTGRWRPRSVARGADEEEAGDTPCGGRGLRLVEAYAASCCVTVTAGGTRVTAELVPGAGGGPPLGGGAVPPG
ncbi:ATP-binding protein [Streptomyces sp. XD-27]|uniref:ATP-binding protein n=1 Tax=Streptomyces sp. XD-27 TaxID=3062779 RepID=UPI0026F47785|nr:ATP-binding protein [Streptomyces sp. XD-27]WKX69187.1 ATP-binding protein [Streptomyces sp. XD-27]